MRIPSGPAEAERKPSRIALEAEGRVQLRLGSADWERYAVTAEVMLGGSREPLTLAVAEGKDARPGYQLELRAQPGDKFKALTSASSRDGDLLTRAVRERRVKHWLPLWARPDPQALGYSESEKAREAAVRRLHAEFAAALGWDERWLRLRAEVTPRQARLWADGLLVASADFPKWARGPASLTLNRGDRVRLLRVEKLPPEIDGFLPLDLTARFNANAIGPRIADGLPAIRRSPPGDLGDGRSLRPEALPRADCRQSAFIQVGGVPFSWNCGPGKPNQLDVGQVDYRGREAYVRTEAASNDPKRVMLRVPRRQYSQIVLIAAADTRADCTPVLNVRMVKPYRGMVLDRCHPVPRWSDADGGPDATPLPIGPLLREGKPSEESGRLWLVRIPLDPGAFQDFLASDDEYALEIDLNGPPVKDGYPEAPQKSCGVHIFAATLVESPVEMTVTSDEVGHIFVQPQTPAFKVHLRNTTPGPQSGEIEAKVTDSYGKSKTHKAAYSLPPGQSAVVTMSLPADVLGLHDLDVRLLGQGGIRRQTTFALLPLDTRQADRDSPFGMWVFVKSHFGADADGAGSLMSKIGVRWTHVSQEMWDQGFSKRYRIYPAYTHLLWQVNSPEEALKKIAANPQHQYWTVFAEQALSERHYGYFPPELLEKPAPRKLTDDEEKLFGKYWDLATACSEAARQKHPDLKLIFGNGYPQFIATFLSRKYPRKYVDGLALDFMGDGMYMFFYLREVAKHYGYGDLPFHITEGFYVCSGCGYYPDREREKEQGDTYIRGLLRGFALGMERYGTACEIWDPGSDYYYTGYGSVGLCHKAPELNPKPGYPAFGTMTRLLDKAKFHSLVPTGSVDAYALRFDGPGGPVYALWTARGRRPISLRVKEGAKPRLTDSQSNSRPLAVEGGRVGFEIDPTPLWVEDAGPIGDVGLGTPVYDSAPGPNAKLLARIARLDDWPVDPAPCPELEKLDDDTPVKLSSFGLAIAEGRRAPRAGERSGEKALAVTLRDEPGVSPHRLRYSVLRPKADLVIPAGTAQLGLWLYGNGAGWVDLELTDAKGERWTSVRRPRGYGFGMPYAGFHAFDGWCYVPWPLPGTKGEKLPAWARWRSEKGNGVLDFPVRLTGLILEQYGKVVSINELVPANGPTWRVGDLLLE